jgi:hypothetical protein
MKVKFLFFTILLLIGLNQVNAQISGDMQAMHMIKDFYTAYSLINLKTVNRHQLDSLIDKYFTPSEGKKIKKGYNEGHDIMTNDSGISYKSLETMVIRTISDEKSLNIQSGKYEIVKGVKDAYEVSYVVNPITPKLNETITETAVEVDILVVNDNGALKISRVSNNIRYDSVNKN